MFQLVLALISGPIQPADSLPAWVSVDSAKRSVTFELVVTRPPGASSALINGSASNKLQLVVPRGWTVNWRLRNEDSTSAHSLVVMTEREKLPQEGGRPAFTNAMTRSLMAGLPSGGSDSTTFEADEAGWYWLLCGVPAHAIAGEYISLRVDPEATGVSVKIKA